LDLNLFFSVLFIILHRPVISQRLLSYFKQILPLGIRCCNGKSYYYFPLLSLSYGSVFHCCLLTRLRPHSSKNQVASIVNICKFTEFVVFTWFYFNVLFVLCVCVFFLAEAIDTPSRNSSPSAIFTTKTLTVTITRDTCR